MPFKQATKILLLILFLGQGNLFAQNYPNLINPKKVTTITYWDENDSQSYHFKTISEKFKNDKDKPESQVTTEYDIDLKVVEAADSFYILELVYSNFDVQSNSKKHSIDDDFSSLQNGMKIRYRTNELGQFDTILNLTELALELENQIKTITEALKENLPDEISESEFGTVMDFMMKRFTTPENVEVLFLSDLLTIHGYFGYEFTLEKPEEFEIIYPVFDEFELNGKGTIILSSISKESDSFMINVNSAPSKGELEKYINQIFESFTFGLKGKQGELGDFKITSKSKARYSFELSSGWPKIITETITNTISTKKEKIKTVSKTIVKLN